MDYLTREKIFSTGFTLPLVIQTHIEVPCAQSGYYSVLLWDRGSLEILGADATSVYHGPACICTAPGHTIRDLSIHYDEAGEPPRAYSIILKPEGINTCFTQFPDTFEYRALTSISNGHAYRFLTDAALVRMSDLCREIDLHVNVLQGPLWPCYARSFLLELLLLIDRVSYEDSEFPQSLIPGSDVLSRNIFHYIHTHYYEEISIPSLTDRFATNRTTLNRIFKDCTGMSVMTYLEELRLSIAALLLRNTGLPIQSISQRIGYSDEGYFSRAFKKKNGLSPRDFRRRSPHPYGAAWSVDSLK
ncbi:MAG: helix-turn-helix transcriptional regulator [Spirochaetales bacterium]|nr:helix-turn-helix transcriptional regulator [Spirochaetales bacterium]